MSCQSCNLKEATIAVVSAKTSDCCSIAFPNYSESSGYVSRDIGIGGGDYISFRYCMNCGLLLEILEYLQD